MNYLERERDDDGVLCPRCVICGEFTTSLDIAEMYDPNDTKDFPESGYVHPQCGLQKGWEVA